MQAVGVPHRPPAGVGARATAPRRRRIAMVAACPFPFPRGTPARIFRMSEALARSGHDVHVVTTHLGRPAGPLPFAVHRIARIPTYTRTAAGPTYQKLLLVDPLLATKMLSVVRELRPDLIHAHHYEGLALALPVRALTGVPVVYDAHTLLASELGYYDLGLSTEAKRRLGAWIDRRLPSRADLTIAVTEEIRAVLARAARPGRPIHVIGSGVEPELLPAVPPPDEPGAPRRLVYAGGFAAYQRIDLLLEAFRRVLEHRPDVRLFLVTSEPSASLRAEVARRGLGASAEVVEAEFKEVAAYFRKALIALNARIECAGVPQKLLNYLAAGRAVVTFEGSARHLRHGENALLVPDGDVGAFADAVLGLLDDPARARRLGEAGRRLAVREFSWERMASRVEEAYAALLDGRAARG